MTIVVQRDIIINLTLPPQPPRPTQPTEFGICCSLISDRIPVISLVRIVKLKTRLILQNFAFFGSSRHRGYSQVAPSQKALTLPFLLE